MNGYVYSLHYNEVINDQWRPPFAPRFASELCGAGRAHIFLFQTMKLLMISGDRSILQGKKGAFWYTLEEFHKHWDRIDVICPKAKNAESSAKNQEIFGKVFFHPNPKGLWFQQCWIRKKGMELVQKHTHDVMTVHDYPPFYNGAGAMFLGKKAGIPYALEVHHIVGHPHAASLFEWIGKWQSRFYFPFAAKRASMMRVVSNETGDVLEQWGVPRNKITQLSSAYLDFAALIRDPSIEKRFDLACCARFVPNKGLTEVLDAVASLPNVTLLLIGDGPLRSNLEKQIRKLNIAERVTFTGWLSDRESVYKALQSARIFVMNSKSEGGPRVAVEAMALGLPVIGTNVGVLRQMEKANIVLFTSGTAKDLTEKIHTLLQDASRRESMVRDALNTVVIFDRSLMIRAYADTLKELSSRTISNRV